MIFVWSGRGPWVFGVLALTLAAAAAASQYAALAPGQRYIALLMAFVVAGVFSILLGLHARRSAPRPVLERQTGRELMRRPVHSVYWLRAEYWGLLYLGLAVWLLLAGLR